MANVIAVTMRATQEARKSLSRLAGTLAKETEGLVVVLDTGKIYRYKVAAKKG